VNLMRALYAAGFFDLEPIDVNGTPVVPREFT
jgi:saccharopine dehydrogenase-like NADP-dependent oxidoreductase